MIYLHKILPLLASPILLVIFFILLGLIINSRKLIYFGFLVLLICSFPPLSRHLISILEEDYKLQDVSSTPPAAAIVVLSGFVVPVKTETGLKYELSEASDRLFAGISLLKANKAPHLILTKGYLPWSIGKPEGEYLRDLAIDFGVPENKILLTEIVQNTDQEAKAVKTLLSMDSKKVILVTSAFHMPRAIKVFEAAGLVVIPFAVDFRSKMGGSKITPMDFIPSAGSLQRTSFFVREMLGRLYYEIKYN